MDLPGVWLIVGVQASGKSTVADLLAARFERSVHIPGSAFYRWVRAGWIPMDKPEPPGARTHLALRYRLSAQVADTYADTGFTAVVQDNIYGADVIAWLERVQARPRHLVVLRPRTDVVASRERERRAATGKVAYRPEGWTIAELDAALAELPPIGLWIDNSDLTPDATVDRILRDHAQSVVDDPLPPAR